MKHFLMGASALAVLAACATPTTTDGTDVAVASANTSREVVTTAKDYWGDHGIDQTAMDESVGAGTDFYKFANGKWLSDFEIPADRARYGAFTLLAEKSEQRVKYIIEDLAAEAPSADTLEGKVAAFYNAYTDTDAIEAAGLEPVKPYLAKIAAIQNRNDLAKLFAATGYSSPIGGWVDVDSKKTDRYIFYVNTGGLGLPDRDYYFKTDEKSSDIRKAYLAYLTTLLTEAGYDDPATAASRVMSLETEMAGSHWDRALGRNRDLTYNLVSAAELKGMGNGFPVGLMLSELGLGDQSQFVVRQVKPTAQEIADAGYTPEQAAKLGDGVSGLFKVAAQAPLDSWKAYLTAHFLSDHASVLPKTIDDASFEFYGKTLRGQEEQRERWKRGVRAIDGTLGEAVGKVYVDRHFPPASKVSMDELVENLRKAMEQNLDNLDWMGADTKVEARAKLAAFEPLIGYPENFETYEGLTITADSAFQNNMSASEWGYKDMLSDLGKPIDRTEWFMNPQTVNAYYSPNRNQIVFPAAILEAPFFNASADAAVNYGAIGGVIGHEMGHGFDDQGAKSDGTGLLRDWWTEADKTAFETRTKALVEQYDAFCPFEGDTETCVNGKLTLGENIGDLGGLSLAYTAYKLHLDGKEDKVLNGLTGDQRFFLAWAQVWRAKYRDEAKRQQLLTDPHSPPYYRVNGVVRNMDAWYEAFGVTKDDPMYLPPEQRIKIW